MIRWTAVRLFVCCLVGVGLRIGSARGQDSAAQNPTAQSSPGQGAAASAATENSAQAPAPGQETEAAVAKPGFPLDEFTEFSAIMIGSVISRDRGETYIYRSGSLLRNEGPMEKGYFITDLAEQVTYGQNRLGCVKDAHPYLRAWPFTASRAGHTGVRAAVGKETVDGRVCQVEDVTITGKDLKTPTKLRFWEPEGWKGFPIKIEDLSSKGTRIIKFKDVTLGPPDPTLFIYPNDCGATLPKPKSATAPRAKAHATPPPATNPPQ